MLQIGKNDICNWESDLCPNVMKNTHLRLLTGQLCLILEVLNIIFCCKSYVLTWSFMCWHFLTIWKAEKINSYKSLTPFTICFQMLVAVFKSQKVHLQHQMAYIPTSSTLISSFTQLTHLWVISWKTKLNKNPHSFFWNKAIYSLEDSSLYWQF